MRLGTAALALAIALGAHLRLSGIPTRYRIPPAGDEKTIAAAIADQSGEIACAETSTGPAPSSVGQSAISSRACLTVRLSATTRSATWAAGSLFSAAIIGDGADGLVISSIHARGESRTYAKGVVEGDGKVTLTPEEQQVRAAARTGKGSE